MLPHCVRRTQRAALNQCLNRLIQPQLLSSTPCTMAISPRMPTAFYSSTPTFMNTTDDNDNTTKSTVIGGLESAAKSSKKLKDGNSAENTKAKGYTGARNNRAIVKKQEKINAAHEEKAKKEGLGWRIVGATVLHRYPTILPDMEPWQVAFDEVEDKIASKKREWFMEQVGGTDSQMIPDDEPSYEEILATMPFQPAPRTTEADAKNDVHSTDRNLTGSLYLIVKRNRSDFAWQFPQGKIQPDEKTMRSVAERVIDRAVGNVNRWFISNAPIGHYCYEYPQAIKEKRKEYGTKVFFYRAQLIAGNVRLETRLYKDYAWISRNQVKDYFDEQTAAYMTAILPE